MNINTYLAQMLIRLLSRLPDLHFGCMYTIIYTYFYKCTFKYKANVYTF